MLAIRGIDSDRNGYITQTELDDILKLILSKEELEKSEMITDAIITNKVQPNISGLQDTHLYNLKPFYINHVASANRILVDYKSFRDFLIQEIKKMKDKCLRASRASTISKAQEKINKSRSTSQLSVILEKTP